jgi:hypothetical protein
VYADSGIRELATVLADLVDRGGSRATKKIVEAPKCVLDCVTMLVLAIRDGAFRDGLALAVNRAECTPAGTTFLKNEIAGIVSLMHPAFANQTSDDTVGFVHMLIRYMGQLPPAKGNLPCKPLSPETQQMAVTFFRDCLARHQEGTDLAFLAERTLCSDMGTAITREWYRIGVAAQSATPNATPYAAKKRPFAKTETLLSTGLEVCRNFATNGTCRFGASCKFSHSSHSGVLALPAPPPFPRFGGAGRGHG